MKKNHEYFERVKSLNNVFLKILAEKSAIKLLVDHEFRTDKSFIGKEVHEISSSIAIAELNEKTKSKVQS